MSSTFTVCGQCNKVNKINPTSAQSKVPTCGHCGAQLDFKDGVTNLSASQAQVLIQKSPIPVVIDFWAPWCGPCRSFAPTFSSVAHELQGQFVFVKINTEQDQFAGSQFGIRGIPTIAIFKNGKELDRQSGALPKDYFSQWLLGNR